VTAPHTNQESHEGRAVEVAQRLAHVRGRIERACHVAGRSPGDIVLVVVTKTYPASDVRILSRLGVTDVGENRHQEAVGKVEACWDLPVRWHLVGQLQTNKAGAVARYADVVHSVDRSRLVDALQRGAASAERDLDVLLQVNLDPEPGLGRGGALPEEVGDLADRVAAAERLRLRGVMAVAPLGADPAGAFARLAQLSAHLRASHPAAEWISAGMSGDLEPAIQHGATHLRVGSAILGARRTSG
jgi:pyridoxal phosphate enzyme (YggS family)